VIATIDRIGPDLALQSGGLVRDPSQTPSSSPLSQPTSGAPPPQGGSSFRDALSAAADEHSLSFSEHAMKRVEQRQIPMAGDQMDRLSKAMDTLSQRGSHGQSLVMLDQYAYVVHVPSHTVVTAVEPDQNKERVFTQIDSVVIA
jgi:flagellar operon protein